MERKTFRIITVFFALAGIVIFGFAWFTAKRDATPVQHVNRNIYDADIPPHENVPFDYRFILLSAFDCAKAPLADVFTSPLGSEEGAFTYTAQDCGDGNSRRGGPHWGADLNGIGGENTDEGDPVYAAGRGRVVYCGEPNPSWGNVVVLLHRLPNGSLIQSLYAHLDSFNVRVGQVVPRGQVIGKVGTAHGLYAAHLHFEMIATAQNEAGLPGYGKSMGARLKPSDILKEYAPSKGAHLPDLLPALQGVQADLDLEQMEIKILPAPDSAK